MLNALVLNQFGQDFPCLIEYKNEEAKGKKLIVFKHGFCGHKITSHRFIVNASHKLVDLGYTVVRFDCPGSGDAEGDQSFMTIRNNVEVLKYVLNYLNNTLKPERIMILGYSMGGLEASLCADEIDIEGLTLIAPCSNTYENIKFILGNEKFQQGLQGQDVDNNGDRIGKEYFIDLDSDDINPILKLKNFNKPIRIVHGTKDDEVEPWNAKNYQDNLKNCQVKFIEGTNHTFDSWEFQEELYDNLIRFAKEILN